MKTFEQALAEIRILKTQKKSLEKKNEDLKNEKETLENEQKQLKLKLQWYEEQLKLNRAERSIKPFVMGRKNWLFCNTPKGAKSSAIVYSIIETAKENGLNPFEYLKCVIFRIVIHMT